MANYPFYEESLPNIQSNSPLVQLETLSSRSVTYHLRDETDNLLAALSFQVVVEQ